MMEKWKREVFKSILSSQNQNVIIKIDDEWMKLFHLINMLQRKKYW